MPLQNRVTPFGDLAALPGRGLVMGNRGILHDHLRRIVRPWQLRRWIACRTEFRGRRRVVMQPRSYTELFFLDEAAAFSAGHRPCAECRRADYRRFLALWEIHTGARANADAMDAVLHSERLEGRRKRTYRTGIDGLPNGAYLAIGGEAWLLWGNAIYAWSDAGYTQRAPRPRKHEVEVLTPPSIVAIFAAGYEPMLHPSAG